MLEVQVKFICETLFLCWIHKKADPVPLVVSQTYMSRLVIEHWDAEARRCEEARKAQLLEVQLAAMVLQNLYDNNENFDSYHQVHCAHYSLVSSTLSAIVKLIKCCNINPRIDIESLADVQDLICSPCWVHMDTKLWDQMTAPHNASDQNHFSTRCLTCV